MKWSYGVTTVPERRSDLLPWTLKSLANAGFDQPRLFIDGVSGRPDWATELAGENVTSRWPKLGAWGNWILALYELYIREPVCERYAIFQDDILAVKGLRAYLDTCKYPDGTDGRPPGFWNLCTMRGSSEWRVADAGKCCGWIEGAFVTGKVPNSERLQQCAGALGLVFNRRAVQIILGAQSSVEKPATPPPISQRNIDGQVVTCMNLYCRDPQTGEEWPFGWREYVHGPSLLTHTGTASVVRDGKVWQGGLATTWPGEGVDIRELMGEVLRS